MQTQRKVKVFIGFVIYILAMCLVFCLISMQNSAFAEGTTIDITIEGEISAIDRHYDGTDIVELSCGEIKLVGVVYGDDVFIESESRLWGIAEQIYAKDGVNCSTAFVLGGVDAAKYSIEQRTDFKVNITPKPITITANEVSSVYGEEHVLLTDNREAVLINGDTLTGSLSVNVNAQSKVGEYNIISTLNNPNYDITFFGEGRYRVRENPFSADIKTLANTNNALTATVIVSFVLLFLVLIVYLVLRFSKLNNKRFNYIKALVFGDKSLSSDPVKDIDIIQINKHINDSIALFNLNLDWHGIKILKEGLIPYCEEFTAQEGDKFTTTYHMNSGGKVGDKIKRVKNKGYKYRDKVIIPVDVELE